LQVGIMQPYFFPYIGYFALIANTDLWVVFDTSQYTPKSWINRNRILHPSGGWMYLTVPLANSSQSIVIREANILDIASTKVSLLGKLSHYRKRAPFYSQVSELVADAFDGMRSDSLVECNLAGLQQVCRYLGLDFDYQVCSQMGLDLGEVEHPGGWAPAIAGAVGASSYLNPSGGKALFDPEEFSSRNIELKLLEMPEFEYDTGSFGFEPALSIIDVMMWNSPSAILDAIETAQINTVGD